MRICFYTILAGSLLCFTLRAGASQPVPQRIPHLDSLASDISLLGFIPSGGKLPVLAASDGWFNLISGVRLLPEDSDEMTSILADTSGITVFYGFAPWNSEGDIVLVTAPKAECIPRGVTPSIMTGTEVGFYIDGFESLDNAAAAVGTPDMEIVELDHDSTGRFCFSTPLRGIYWVEVMWLDESGPSIAFLFPVISGGSAYDVFSGSIGITDSEASSPHEILDELNRMRDSRGLPLLEASPVLDSLAAERAGNLAFSGSSSHFDRSFQSLMEMLPEDVSFFGENIGRGKGYQEAWSMILISPFHLQTCLSADYTHAGMAGAVDASEYEWQLVLVQVFAAGMGGE
jgi:hypothetical protein